MNSASTEVYDSRIKVHDMYLIALWDTNYFEPRPDDKRICGKRVAEGLFSIEAFATNSKPEFRIARALADQIRPELARAIKGVEDALKSDLEKTRAELADPLVQAVDVSLPVSQEYTFTIDKGKGAPLVNGFIRLFVIMDQITICLKELHYRGVLSKSDYKKRENEAAKPLRKIMNDLNLIIKKYHQQRKELTKK